MDKYVIDLNENLNIPKYMAITHHIKNLIDKNFIKDAEKLPSIRKLSKKLNVSNITIVNSYKKLEMEGYAIQKMGSGTYAKRKDNTIIFKRKYAKILRKITKDELKQYIDFSAEAACSELFPIESFKEVINEVLDRDGIDALTYQEPIGYEGLRETINCFFGGNQIKKENILIVSGAQQGIDIVSKALINVNDNVVVEKPTYGGALAVFRWRRANIFEVPMNKGGMDLDYLEKLARKNRISCVYLMSYFQNPTGMSYSDENKKRLLNMAAIYDFYIIEDDYLSELIYNNMEYKSFKSMDVNDRVIYIKSFSKIFLPGVRLGYLVSPDIFKESIQNSKVNTDIATSSLMQRALELYIRNGMWKKHINILGEVYKDRYRFMTNCLKELGDKVSFCEPHGGLHFYLKINKKDMDCRKLFYKCKEGKVLITPGIIYYKNPMDGKLFFRLGFSQIDKKDIEKGISIIKKYL